MSGALLGPNREESGLSMVDESALKQGDSSELALQRRRGRLIREAQNPIFQRHRGRKP